MSGRKLAGKLIVALGGCSSTRSPTLDPSLGPLINSLVYRRYLCLRIWLGPSTFSMLRNLVSPAKPGDKTFEELVALLKQHYNPTPSETVQRAKFHSRVRKPRETIADFVAELRSPAEFCDFGASHNKMLRETELFVGLTMASFSRDYWRKKNLHL